VTKNELKYYASLLKKKYRDEENKFIVEGEKFIQEGINENLLPEIIVTTSETYKGYKDFLSQEELKKVKVEKLKSTEFSKLSDTKNSQGIAAVFKKRENNKNINGENSGLTVCLDRISDPGNVGTILRTCSWFGIKNVLLTKECADVYNAKTIRASAGSIFHLNVFEEINENFLISLKDESFKILLADLQGADVFNYKFEKKIILVFSNEAAGPSKEIIKICDDKITIPKFGKVESLNVASASAIIIGEVVKSLS
jgi:RNA methyltransferase, TrmH family